jgi:hypothetical protein
MEKFIRTHPQKATSNCILIPSDNIIPLYEVMFTNRDLSTSEADSALLEFGNVLPFPFPFVRPGLLFEANPSVKLGVASPRISNQLNWLPRPWSGNSDLHRANLAFCTCAKAGPLAKPPSVIWYRAMAVPYSIVLDVAALAVVLVGRAREVELWLLDPRPRLNWGWHIQKHLKEWIWGWKGQKTQERKALVRHSRCPSSIDGLLSIPCAPGGYRMSHSFLQPH